GNALYLSFDEGDTWTKKLNYGTRSLFNTGSKVFAATTDGLYSSDNNGQSWINVNNQSGLTLARGLFVSTNGTIYVGTERNGLFISNDEGSTWVNKTELDGLAGNHVNSVYVKSESIYVATSAGLSISADNGETWATAWRLYPAYTVVVGDIYR